MNIEDMGEIWRTLVIHERRIAELEAEQNYTKFPGRRIAPEDTDGPDYTCPICGKEWDEGCCHMAYEAIAAANRKIRELKSKLRIYEVDRPKAIADLHREALESAKRMLECKGYFGAADLVHNHKVSIRKDEE